MNPRLGGFWTETFELIQIHPVVPLRISPFSIEECVTALEFLPQYAAFRGALADASPNNMDIAGSGGGFYCGIAQSARLSLLAAAAVKNARGRVHQSRRRSAAGR